MRFFFLQLLTAAASAPSSHVRDPVVAATFYAGLLLRTGGGAQPKSARVRRGGVQGQSKVHTSDRSLIPTLSSKFFRADGIPDLYGLYLMSRGGNPA